MGALSDAVRTGSQDDVIALLAAEPDAAADFDESGLSALLLGLYTGKPEMAALIAAHRQIDLFEAAALGDAGRLGELLADDNTLARAVAPDGFTPLHLAAYFGHPHAVAVLLEAGADANVEARNASRVQALHSALAGSEPMIAQALLAAGASVDAQQNGGWTALHAGARNGNQVLVEVLLAAGADPKLANDAGLTPADLARESGHNEVCSFLEAL